MAMILKKKVLDQTREILQNLSGNSLSSNELAILSESLTSSIPKKVQQEADAETARILEQYKPLLKEAKKELTKLATDRTRIAANVRTRVLRKLTRIEELKLYNQDRIADLKAHEVHRTKEIIGAMRGSVQEIKQQFQMTESRRLKLKLLLSEVAYRRLMPVRCYVPQPKQLAFHQSKAPERLILGANRGMKTTACAMEVAWAVTGTHPYIQWPKENGRFMVVAKNIIKIGQVLYRKLCKPGLFQMVRRADGMSYPWNPEIDGWDCKKYPSIPALDARMFDGKIAWERKGIDCPKLIRLWNGWEITFWSSEGKPPNGVDVTGAWFDEEVESEDWYTEISARLIDQGGRFIWSATPQAATDVLWQLHEKALAERGKPRPLIEEFHCLLDDNPFITDEDKEIFKAKAAMDPDNYRVRVLGEFKVQSHRVYPEFNRADFVVPMFQIPDDWCRYLVLDPGIGNMACIFFAVPPPDDEQHAGYVYAYDAVYTHNLNVHEQVQRIAGKASMQTFQAFIIDDHGGRVGELGGKSKATQYAEQFELNGLESVETGNWFLRIGGNAEKFGKRSLPTQISQVKSWLHKRPNLGPILRIFEETTGEFVTEMMKYKNKTVDGRPTDEPDERRWSHGPDALRYAVLHGLPYVRPRPKKVRSKHGPQWRMKQKRRRKRQESDGNYVLLGSG